MAAVDGNGNWAHASSSAAQRDRIRKAFEAARGRDERHLLILAMAERNRTRAREPRRSLPPIHGSIAGLSSYEATLLLRRLQDAEGGPCPSDCARCARIGLEPRTPCVHDAGEKGRDAEFNSHLRRKGLVT